MIKLCQLRKRSTDSNDQIVKYVQGDNTVVNHGKDCVAENTFGVDSPECVGNIAGTAFNYIAIGNGTQGVTIPAFSNLIQLTNSTANGCTATGESGEINRFQVTPTRTSAATNSSGTVGTGTVIELNTATAFDFTTANATTIYQSGIFNSAETAQSNGQCDTAPKGGVGTNMFAIQELNSANGIVVTDGDSLSVKWTITVG